MVISSPSPCLCGNDVAEREQLNGGLSGHGETNAC